MEKNDLKNKILSEIIANKEVRTADLIKKTGFTRAYLGRFLKELRQEGKIVSLGKTNRAVYVAANQEAVLEAKKKILYFSKTYSNDNLSEHTVLEEIKRETGIFLKLKDNVKKILDYAFSEMLNNAIDHSQSKWVDIKFDARSKLVSFTISDSGIGIFNNIMQAKQLKSEIEAAQDLLKGKQTTAPERHSGEGIFFTSKLGSAFTIFSGRKEIMFNNLIRDVFIRDLNRIKVGTSVFFVIDKDSEVNIKEIFDEYSGDSYEFDKTKVDVRLYKMGNYYISRSQARRVMAGLEGFKRIVLDFKNISTVGQAFADEIFRVWLADHSGVEITTVNSNENINAMISRAGFKMN
jgi:anti-sigma regulatory factor (Ser/Thr protein kinase)